MCRRELQGPCPTVGAAAAAAATAAAAAAAAAAQPVKLLTLCADLPCHSLIPHATVAARVHHHTHVLPYVTRVVSVNTPHVAHPSIICVLCRRVRACLAGAQL
jgi:hypothetical protein